MLDSESMIAMNDPRWEHLAGGYKVEFDARPFLAKLEMGNDTDAAWRDLWENLHHQGDVGDAS